MQDPSVRCPCPDPECKEGRILVFNIYSANPFQGEWEICDTCEGRGYVVVRLHGKVN